VVIKRSLNKADCCRCVRNAWGKKIKLLEEAISEILVAVTHSESGAEGSKMFCDLQVTITNTGQRNHVPNCAAIFVVLVAREREVYKCVRCEVGLCMVLCFMECHNKVNL
jgi:hypothetical protein